MCSTHPPTTKGSAWLLESLASGTPVIGTRVGGVPDILEDGVTGYIVERSPSAVATGIVRLANNQQQLDDMSEAARKSAEHRTWDRVAGDVERVYQNVRGSTDGTELE